MTNCSRIAEKTTVAALAGWLLLLPCPAATADDALGRLFFTPERRQQLDHQREMNTLDQQQIVADPTLTVDGVVARSSGKHTAWINGSPQHEYETGSGLSVTPRRGDPGKVVVQANDSPTASARVGETVNRNTGESIDMLNGGRVHVGSKAKQ